MFWEKHIATKFVFVNEIDALSYIIDYRSEFKRKKETSESKQKH